MLRKGFSRLFAIVVLFSISPVLHGQNLTKSPYSVIGIGEIHFAGNAQLYGIGQTTQGYRRPYEINNLNPASYSSLQQTVFEAGYLYATGFLRNTSTSSEVDNASFAYFNFAMPLSVKRGIGLAFGLQPYSTVGYDLTMSKVYPGAPDYVGTTKMQGTGGINKFYVGTGVRVHKNISVGLNINYLFGRIETSQQLMFDTIYHKFNIAEERKINIADFDYELALQFHKSINEKYKLTAGLTYGFQNSLKSKYDFTNRTLGWGGVPQYTLDTNVHNTSSKGTVLMPQRIKAGLGIERKGNWYIAADINYTQWSAFKSFGLTDNLKNSLAYSVGSAFIPDANAPKNYLRRMEYRLGARYDNGNIHLNGKDITSYALTAGLGFPMGKSKSRLNISVEYISKGTTENNLIKEEFFRIIFGITFSDQWFTRYQYD